MRRTWAVLVVAGASLVAVSCSSTPTRHVIGSGRMTRRDLAVGRVSRIEAGSVFKVSVSVGSRDAVTLHYDDNLEAYLDVGEEGGTLRLDMKPNVSLTKVILMADVRVTSLSEVQVSGASSVQVMDPVVDSPFSLDLSGASRFEGELRVEAADLWLSGAALAKLSGTAGKLGLSGSGAGGVEAPALRIGALNADLSGATTARVSVSDSIEATLSGATTLVYSGDPKILRRDLSGAATMTRA